MSFFRNWGECQGRGWKGNEYSKRCRIHKNVAKNTCLLLPFDIQLVYNYFLKIKNLNKIYLYVL
jgi:hypothetical protein